MITARDIAAVIVDRKGAINEMKLQKLVYYCQAWHLAWYGQALFADEAQAWEQGPVLPVLRHASIRGRSADELHLPDQVRDVLEHVLNVYGRMSAGDLSRSTHAELPYIEARRGLSSGAPSAEPISLDTMRRYYRRLTLRPDEAVAYAMANARAEGVRVDAHLAQVGLAIASGDLDEDEAIEQWHRDREAAS